MFATPTIVPIDETPDGVTGSTAVGSVAPPGGPQRAAGRHQELVAELADPAFPVALRGYDRVAVDDYLVRVRAALAELETSRSPDAAVRQALDAVGEETKAILQRAQQSADHLTARQREQSDAMVADAERTLAGARAEAERIVAAAHADRETIRAEANAQVGKLDADVDVIWQERARLIEDVRGLGAALEAMADEAETRFPAEPDAEAGSPSALQLVEQPTVEAAPPLSPDELAEAELDAQLDDEAMPPDADVPGPATPGAQATAEDEPPA
jgi:DivIVA domain-containing protein